MATTTTLTGPIFRVTQIPVATQYFYVTYVVEDRNTLTGTTKIRYSVFQDQCRKDNVTEKYYVGDVLTFPAATSSPVITYWYTNPETGNTFQHSTISPNTPGNNQNHTKDRVDVTSVFNDGDSIYYRRWIIEDAILIVDNLEAYDLTLGFQGKTVSYDITQTFTLALNNYALLSGAPASFTDESSPTVQYVNPKGSKVKTMRFGIFNAATDQPLVDYQDMTNTTPTSGSYTFHFNSSDQANFYEFLSKTTSGKVYFALETLINGTVNVSTMEATLELVNYAPVLESTVIDSNATTVALTGNKNKFIKYYSTADFAVNATARKSAIIKSYKTTHNGAIYSNATGRVNNIEQTKFVMSATDSRNITTSKTVTVSMINYIKLTCNISADLPTNDDTIPVTASGNFWNGNFGAVTNTLQLQYRYKSNTNNTYTSWTTAVANATPSSGNTYSSAFNIPVPNHVDKYTVQVRAIDKLATVASKTASVQAFPIFDWSATDFNFNIPVSIQNDLSVAGNITLDGSQLVDFVVQAGASGIWTYRKWASGIAECWGTVAPAAHSITTAWGSLFIKDNAIARTSYPFSFTDVPVVSMTLYNTSGNCWYYTGTQGTNALTPAFGLARGTSGSVTTGAQITAIGRWK